MYTLFVKSISLSKIACKQLTSLIMHYAVTAVLYSFIHHTEMVYDYCYELFVIGGVLIR